MAASVDHLVTLLERAPGIDEFVAVERRRRGARFEAVGPSGFHRRWLDDRQLALMAYRDTERGRGSATLRAAGGEPDRARLIEAAAEQAARSIGPAWTLPPPAAPARVDIDDPGIGGDLMDTAARLRDRIERLLAPRGPAGAAVATRTCVEVLRDRVAVRTSNGFAHAYAGTLLAVAVDLVPGGAEPGAFQPVRLRCRRLADLDLEAALERAARALGHARRARPAAPGRYDVLLTGDALTPRHVIDMAPDLDDPATREGTPDRPGPDIRRTPGLFGWFAPVVAQADAGLVRRGLSRYRPGQSIYRGHRGGRDPIEPITVRSDGAAPFGLLSQPVGDMGEPVRRFALVERGVARDLALDLREAALRGRTANGGVRNLDIAPGATALADLREPGERGLLEVVELAGLHIDARTGAYVAEVGLGFVREAGERRPVTGVTLRGNVFEHLAGARLSSEQVGSGWYRGPAGIRFSGVQVS